RDERSLLRESGYEPCRDDAGAARRFEHAHAGLDRHARREIVRVAVEEERPEIAIVVLGDRPDERGIAIGHGVLRPPGFAPPCHEIFRPSTIVLDFLRSL